MNIERELGRRPEYISGNEKQVFIAFKELSGTEKLKLDQIMSKAEAGSYPRSTEGYTVFKVKDVWDCREMFERVIDRKVMLFVSPIALPDGTHIHELWIEGTLTPHEKELVKRAYASLISET